jgi:hypothetical protein
MHLQQQQQQKQQPVLIPKKEIVEWTTRNGKLVGHKRGGHEQDWTDFDDCCMQCPCIGLL